MRGIGRDVRFESDECEDGLAGQLIRRTNNCNKYQQLPTYSSMRRKHTSSLSNTGMQDQRRLNLSRTQPVSRHVDDIVHTALNPNIPMLVASRAVAGVEHARVRLHVRLEVPLVVLVNRASNGRPRVLDDEHTLDIISLQLLKVGNKKLPRRTSVSWPDIVNVEEKKH